MTKRENEAAWLRGEGGTMRKGFTLIELLVVIAIIAILAAILFPAFMRARQMAFQTQCGAHGKQLATAMLMYIDDNNGRFPSAASTDLLDKFKNVTWFYDWPGTPWVDAPWGVGAGNDFRYIHLAPYVRNVGIWICPSANNLHSLKYAKGYRECWCFLTVQYMYGNDFSTYPDTEFQYDKRRGDPERLDGVGRTLAEVQATDLQKWHSYRPPSKKVFAFCYALGPDVHVERYAGGPYEPPLYPHNEGTIYVYLDGHARWRETGCGWAPVNYTRAHIDRAHPHT